MAEPQTAFNALLDLAQRSRRSARSLPSTVKVQPQWSGIGFTLLGRHFVAPLGEVTELLEVPSYTRLPGVQPWIIGVANVRGRLLPLMDLAAFFGGKLEGQRKHFRVLVLEYGDFYTGMVVNSALGMQHFLVDSYSDRLDALDSQLRDFVAGSYGKSDFGSELGSDDGDNNNDAADEQRWYVFNPTLLVGDPRFANAAL